MTESGLEALRHGAGLALFALMLIFVHRSFYGMRIEAPKGAGGPRGG
jgi:hypothetical protein